MEVFVARAPAAANVRRQARPAESCVSKACSFPNSMRDGANSIDAGARTPRALGYRMPAEWEPHAGTWVSWPHNEESWPGKLSRIARVWVEIVRALSPGEAVNILVNDSAPPLQVQRVLEEAGVAMHHVHLYDVATDDAWIRDCGPTFVVRAQGGRDELAIVDWVYNAWGGKYPPWNQDNLVPERLGQILGVPVFTPGIILEGGSIDVNGRGTLLTTESCLLNKNRNAHLTRSEIESHLRDYLGVSEVLWLGDGIAGDDTDGHVDDLARFVGPRTVVAVAEENPRDDNYEPLQANLRRLQKMRDQDGRPLRLVTLPMPEPVVHKDTRLPASYANFYIGNQVVLVPTFDCPRDDQAIATLQSLFPQRRVVGIDAVDMVWGLGTFHCATQQQPVSAAYHEIG